jgi:hypothetical protein
VRVPARVWPHGSVDLPELLLGTVMHIAMYTADQTQHIRNFVGTFRTEVQLYLVLLNRCTLATRDSRVGWKRSGYYRWQPAKAYCALPARCRHFRQAALHCSSPRRVIQHRPSSDMHHQRPSLHVCRTVSCAFGACLCEISITVIVCNAVVCSA